MFRIASAYFKLYLPVQLLLVLLLGAIPAPYAILALVAPEQKAALVELFRATGGPEWHHRTAWTRTAGFSDPCLDTWFGVQCDTTMTNITYDVHLIMCCIPVQVCFSFNM